jgi:hypothetical protein
MVTILCMFGRAGKALVVVAAATGLAMALLACGGSNSASGTQTSEAHFRLGRSKEFLGPKNERNYEATFGKEGTLAELEQVAQIVAESIQARSEHDWQKQCETLSQTGLSIVTQLTEYEEEQGKPPLQGCAAQLERAARIAPPSAIRNNMRGPVAAFRVEGIRGLALYHGDDKKDWAMRMQNEGSEWRVSSLSADPLKRR